MVRFLKAISLAYDAEIDNLPLRTGWIRPGKQRSFWTVGIAPMEVEKVGGAEDGARFSSSFFLSIKKLLEAFDDVTAAYWHHDNAETPVDHITVEGVVKDKRDRSHKIVLSCFDRPEGDDSPGLLLDQSGVYHEVSN